MMTVVTAQWVTTMTLMEMVQRALPNLKATTITGDENDGKREDGASPTAPKITMTTTTKKEKEVEKKRVTKMMALEQYHYRTGRKKMRERKREERGKTRRRTKDEQKRR